MRSLVDMRMRLVADATRFVYSLARSLAH
jgi:hypothetical protein